MDEQVRKLVREELNENPDLERRLREHPREVLGAAATEEQLEEHALRSVERILGDDMARVDVEQEP